MDSSSSIYLSRLTFVPYGQSDGPYDQKFYELISTKSHGVFKNRLAQVAERIHKAALKASVIAFIADKWKHHIVARYDTAASFTITKTREWCSDAYKKLVVDICSTPSLTRGQQQTIDYTFTTNKYYDDYESSINSAFRALSPVHIRAMWSAVSYEFEYMHPEATSIQLNTYCIHRIAELPRYGWQSKLVVTRPRVAVYQFVNLVSDDDEDDKDGSDDKVDHHSDDTDTDSSDSKQEVDTQRLLQLAIVAQPTQPPDSGNSNDLDEIIAPPAHQLSLLSTNSISHSSSSSSSNGSSNSSSSMDEGEDDVQSVDGSVIAIESPRSQSSDLKYPFGSVYSLDTNDVDHQNVPETQCDPEEKEEEKEPLPTIVPSAASTPPPPPTPSPPSSQLPPSQVPPTQPLIAPIRQVPDLPTRDYPDTKKFNAITKVRTYGWIDRKEFTASQTRTKEEWNDLYALVGAHPDGMPCDVKVYGVRINNMKRDGSVDLSKVFLQPVHLSTYDNKHIVQDTMPINNKNRRKKTAHSTKGLIRLDYSSLLGLVTHLPETLDGWRELSHYYLFDYYDYSYRDQKTNSSSMDFLLGEVRPQGEDHTCMIRFHKSNLAVDYNTYEHIAPYVEPLRGPRTRHQHWVAKNRR